MATVEYRIAIRHRNKECCDVCYEPCRNLLLLLLYSVMIGLLFLNANMLLILIRRWKKDGIPLSTELPLSCLRYRRYRGCRPWYRRLPDYRRLAPVGTGASGH